MDTREDEMTRSMLERIRAIRGKAAGTGWGIIKEEKDGGGKREPTDAIAITDDPKFGTNVLSSQIEAFRTQVESGAQFSEADPDKPSDSPLIFMPETKNRPTPGTAVSCGLTASSSTRTTSRSSTSSTGTTRTGATRGGPRPPTLTGW